MLFIALVHPHLEFKITAWSLCLATNKKRLESTVQRAIKVIPDLHGVSVTRTVRLARVEIPSMAYRRARGNMTEVFKYMLKL